MSKNNDNKLIPKLRFPEFTKDNEWILNQLDNVYSFISTNSFSRDDLNYIQGDVKNIHYGDIHTKFSTLFDITKENVPFINESISLDKCKQENYCKEKDMIFADASEDLKDVGKSIELVNLNNEKLLSGLHTIHARQINDEIAVGFGGYLFLNENIRKQIQRESQGAKVLGISATRLSHINIFYPQKKTEQQKIACCLSSLDEVISAEDQKLEVLKEHKKGLLQNLFPQEGETVPRLRFKEFEESGEWIVEGVGNLFKFKQGVQVSVENQFMSKIEGMVRFIRIIDITNNSEPHRFIDNPGNEYVITKNDLFMIRYGTPGLISIGFEGVIANNLFRLIWKYEEIFVPKFWFYAFQRIEKMIYDLSSSSSMPAISFSTMESVSLLLPKNPNEQQKIANTLSSIDDLINAQSKKIEALKSHKKGLLQGLFPTINNEE